MITTSDRLLSEFPDHTYEQWHAAAEALLKGAPFEKLLVSKTYEDITIQPTYLQQDIEKLEHPKHFPGADTSVRGSHAKGLLGAGWEISQELKAKSIEDIHSQIHEGLNGGQSELNLNIDQNEASCKSSAGWLNTIDDLCTALSGVSLDAISTYFQCGPCSVPAASLFLAAAEQMGVDTRQLRGGVENDPLSELARYGTIDESLRFDHMAALTSYAIQHAPKFTTITVKGDTYHNAGATATQELAYVMATIVTYLEKMNERGLSPNEVFPHIRIHLSVGSDYFMEIAKIRATRWLWSKITSAYGVTNVPVHIHASTSKWNKTTYDAHTNMLRVTSEAFSAVVAGVDSLHIGPYDEIAGASDTFSQRIARNLHTILREECGLDQVIDPAGGSTYIEWLTDQVAAKSWELFQDIEKQGGMLDCLKSDTIQQAVHSMRGRKHNSIRIRKDKIVGANMYPDLKGKKLEAKNKLCCGCQLKKAPDIAALNIRSSEKSTMIQKAIDAAKQGATKLEIATAIGITQNSSTPTTTLLTPHRAAEEYESLRDASAAFAVKTGTPPSILQLNMGPSGKYRLRADWTASFFEAAGFKIDSARDFLTQEDAIAALKASTANIAVITSDDGTYQEMVSELATAVKAAKPDITLLLAGAPGDKEAEWTHAGIDQFVHVRSNNYELNEQLLRTSGVIS